MLVLLPDVFQLLLHEIIKKAESVLEQAHISGAVLNPALSGQKGRVFGTGKYHYTQAKRNIDRRSISYAMYVFRESMAQQQPDAFTHKDRFDPKVLQEAYSAYQKSPTKNVEKIDLRHLQFYAQFLGFSDICSWIETAESLSLQIKQEQKSLLPCESPDESYTQQYYLCHHLNNLQGQAALYSFRASFELRKKIINVRFWDTPTQEEYEGTLMLSAKGKEGVITTYTQNKTLPRPLLVALAHNHNHRFMDYDVCLGNYASIGQDLSTNGGLLIFERVADDNSSSQIDSVLLQAYLMHKGNHITQGGFITRANFIEEVRRCIPSKYNATSGKLACTHFEAVILSNRHESISNHQLDISYFHIDKNNTLQCRSEYPAEELQYDGYVEYALPNHAILHLQPNGSGRYQIVVDLHDLNTSQWMDGVYSGINQNNAMVKGRVRFYRISPTQYQESIPRLANADEEAFNALMARDPHCIAFLLGNKPPAHLAAHTGLGKLSGTYFYYRTRTVLCRTREIKRYPVLIKPDGSVLVKIKPDGEASLARGYAFQQGDQIFIHLYKNSRYSGLAVLYPSQQTFNKADAKLPIQAVYASTSHQHQPIAGRLVFLRTNESFDQLQPDYIHIDEAPQRPDVSPEEIPIIQRLVGQLNNYVAVRSAVEYVSPFVGEALFAAACYYSLHGEYNKAFDTLRTALIRGGYHNISQLKEAFSSSGPLFPIKELFRNSVPEQDKVENESMQDQVRFFREIVAQVFS